MRPWPPERHGASTPNVPSNSGWTGWTTQPSTRRPPRTLRTPTLASAACVTTRRCGGRPPRAAYAQRRGRSAFKATCRGLCRPSCEAHGPLGKAPPVTRFVSGGEKGSKVALKVGPKGTLSYAAGFSLAFYSLQSLPTDQRRELHTTRVKTTTGKSGRARLTDDFLPRRPVKTQTPRPRNQDLVSFSFNDVTVDSEFWRSAMTSIPLQESDGTHSIQTGEAHAPSGNHLTFHSPYLPNPRLCLGHTLNVCVKNAGEERTAKVSLFLKSSKTKRILHQL